MAYDFDALTDRRRTNSLKWDVPEDGLERLKKGVEAYEVYAAESC